MDDASTDKTAEIAAHFPCQLIRLTQNLGAAAARNLGARAAHGQILFFLDADIVMERDTVARILAVFAADPTLAALFGSYQKNTRPTNFFSQYKNLLHHYTHQISSTEAATFCSGYGAVRREVFCSLGGFNETHRALEDIELGYRMHRAGHRVQLLKDLQFTHLKTYTLASLVYSDVMHRAAPWTRLMLEQQVFRNDLNTRLNNMLSVILSYVLLLALLWVWFVPLGGLGVLGLVGLIVALNIDFLTFVTRERGWLFGAQTAVMSWFFYIYNGIGLLIGVGAFARERLLPPRR